MAVRNFPLPGKLEQTVFYLEIDGVMMANIHLVGGEKGGVGKSMVARVIAQYLIDKEIPFRGFDTDRSHRSLLRFYSDYATPITVDRYESLDAIMEIAIENPDTRILVDLAAQAYDPLVKWLDESGVLEIADESGIVICYWQVMDSGKDSVDLLKKLLDRFESRLDYVLVLNQLHGDRFDIFERSEEKKWALELNAKIISIRQLHQVVAMKIDASNASFWAARQKSEPDTHGLGLLERQRVRMWLKDAYEQIETVGI